jgi:heavy metal translocating P-type ATPase
MLDVTIILLAYAGIRLYEQSQKTKIIKAREAITPPDRRHYQQMSAVTMGTAALRLLHPSPAFTLLNIATYTYTMLPFYRGVESAIQQRLLQEGKVDSYLLMGFGNLLLLSMNRYFTAAMGVGLAYVGDAIQVRATKMAQQHLTDNLFDNLFDPHQSVWIIKDEVELEIALEHVQQGDILLIKAGETIPVDGKVVAGMASVDQQAFTGESYPVEKGVGEPVFASTLILTGKLQVRVEQSGRETAIGKLGDILAHALQAKTDIQLRGEQWAEAANLPFLGLAGFGLITFGPIGAAVILSGNTVQAIRTLAPLATINYQAVASHRQILIKQGQRLEQISSIDTFLFDKTGTLTDGKLSVSDIHTVHPNYRETDILFYAALAEHQLTHPIAKAIMRHATQAGLDVDNLDDINYRLGYGIVVQFHHHTIHVGSARFMAVEGITLPATVISRQANIHAQGHSLVMVAIDGTVAGIIELQATLRPEVLAVFNNLRQRGIKHIGIVSGDHVAPTQRLAEWLGADSFFAEVLPEDKANIVKQFQAKGHTVGFIGDGVNDTIAMQQADLAISLRGATTLAIDVADIILTHPDLTRLCELLELSRRLEANLKRGLGICYLGMGTVVLGTFLAHIDILVAMGVHFVLGSSAIGNAMLPLLEINNPPLQLVLKTNKPHANSSPPTASVLDIPTDAKPLLEVATPPLSTAAVSSSPIVIVGAGAAGIASALSAAMQGASVVLLEQSGQLGGTVTQALIHTLGGFFDDQGNFLNPGLATELTERLTQASSLTCQRRIGKTWTLSVDPQVYAQVVSNWINEYTSIKVSYHTTITSVSVNAGYIDQITAVNSSENQPYILCPQVLIDTTGNANIVRQIDPSLVKEGVALAGFILQLRGIVPDAVRFPKGVALLQRLRTAVANDELPAECANLWLDSGVYPDEVYVKFNLISTAYDKEQMATVAKQLLTFLQARPDFSTAFISAHGQLGIRDGGRIRGDYILTKADLQKGRRFTDVVCRASWPIEYWHPQQGVILDYFPPGHSYDIPRRSLQVSGLRNLWVAGKCLAAEPLAQASARVVGTCWAMGEGLAKTIIEAT